MPETVDVLVGSQERRNKAHKDSGLEGVEVVKVVSVHPESFENGGIKCGVERECVHGRIQGRSWWGGSEDGAGEREGGSSGWACLLDTGRHGGVHLRTQ